MKNRGVVNSLAMARPLRIEFAGAVCHIMVRGSQGRALCRDEADREVWLATLGAAARMKKRAGRRLVRLRRVLEGLKTGDGEK